MAFKQNGMKIGSSMKWIILAVILAIIAILVYIFRDKIWTKLAYIQYKTNTKQVGTQVPFTGATKADLTDKPSGNAGIYQYQASLGKLSAATDTALRSGDIKDIQNITGVEYATVSWNDTPFGIRDFVVGIVYKGDGQQTVQQMYNRLSNVSWLGNALKELPMGQIQAWNLQ